MIHLSRAEAAARLVSHLGLAQPRAETGAAGARAMLGALRCVQLDPLDPIGTNADLVALARVDGLAVGDIYRALLPGHAFEHFAKERCLLPASRFALWRGQAVETPWWRNSERMRRLDEALIHDVREEIAARGPISTAELTDRGRVDPMDWGGWKGTTRAASLAVEVLFTRCEVVVHDREGGRKRWAVPERTFASEHLHPSTHAFAETALLDRAWAAGLLSRKAGPHWSTLAAERTSPLPDRLVSEGRLVDVEVEGAKGRLLATPTFLEAPVVDPDDRMRILGPLDPMLWDRALVSAAFGFDYVWEVYKPAAKRQYGWYVVPLLHRGRLVGRLEANRGPEGGLAVQRVWWEAGAQPDLRAFDAAIARHDGALRDATARAGSEA